MSKDTSAWKRKFMKELLRERGGEADQEEGGLKTLLKDSTQQSLGLDARRRIELPSDELSLTRRAGGHLLPDDDDDDDDDDDNFLLSLLFVKVLSPL